MWFNNVLVYNCKIEANTNLSERLEEEHLKPCPPHARFIYGWLPVLGEDYAREIAGLAFLQMGKEERILPKAVINRFLAERILDTEAQQGRPISRTEKNQMAEDLEFELLPKAFCLQKKLPAIIDLQHERLFINTSSVSQATQVIALLRKSIPEIHVESFPTMSHLSLLFTQWLRNPSSLPKHLQLASDCVLFSPENEKKKIHCKGYELPADEVIELIDRGLSIAELSLVWHERIQFTLTHEFVLKRVKCLDYLLDEFHETKTLEEEEQQFDATLALLGGELVGLVEDLLKVTRKVEREVEEEALC